ncbi:hypothetical protein V6Z94_010080 [Aspergillus fumigatus]
MRRPAAPTAPGAPGERRRPSNCPHCSPSEPVRTQVIPSDRPRGRWRAAAYGPRVGGPDPADTPTKGGSRGAAPRESGYQDWPAANDPQTPSVPTTGTTPPGFGHPSDVGSRAFLSTAQSGPGTGARRMSRGHGRAHCWTLRTPSTAWTTRPGTLRAGRSRVETTAGMGDCPVPEARPN